MTASIKSNSQYGQDLWVLDLLANKRGGYFLEMGAGDGLWISNTLLLAQKFGWTGILVEPTRVYERLVMNRPEATCVKACVSSDDREVTLFEIRDRGQAEIDLSAADNTLLSAVREDLDPAAGDQINTMWGDFKEAHTVKAIPLARILDEHRAPRIIDYFSLDVEGYEYEVLRTFPFQRYKFRCLGVERPPSVLTELLVANGYKERARLGDDVMFINPSALGFRFRAGELVAAIRFRVKNLLKEARDLTKESA